MLELRLLVRCDWVLYGKTPHWEIPKIFVVTEIVDGVRPESPASAAIPGFTDVL